MTADLSPPLPPAKALKKVCELYLAGNFTEARRIITESAGITPEEQKKIPTGEMGRYIAGKTKNPNILKMLQAELAFYSFAVIKRTEEPTETQAETCISNFEKIMPFQSKQGKTHAKYCIAVCCDYIPEYPETEKYELYNALINELPAEHGDSDRFSFALKINDLPISAKHKYTAIKKAQQKTNQNNPAQTHYTQMLGKLSSQYYDELLSTAQNRQNSYQDRNQAYETAIGVVDDFMLEKIRKNSYKLWLLEQQTILQRENGDNENYSKSSKRKYSLIRQQGLLKYKATGRRACYDNYR